VNELRSSPSFGKESVKNLEIPAANLTSSTPSKGSIQPDWTPPSNRAKPAVHSTSVPTATVDRASGVTAVSLESENQAGHDGERHTQHSSSQQPESAETAAVPVAPAQGHSEIAASILVNNSSEPLRENSGSPQDSNGNTSLLPRNTAPYMERIENGQASKGLNPVQVATIVGKAAESEMRVGLSTSAFGNVEVRTIVHANDVGVVIGSEKGDLKSLLTNELPGITNSLQQQNVRLSEVNFLQQGLAFSSDSSAGGNSHHPADQRHSGSTSNLPSDSLPVEYVPTSELRRAGSTGLSIIA
jgi:hypothetical protein